MPTQKQIPYDFGTFFITFTCFEWLPLLEKAQGYAHVYNWFNILIEKGHYINGYVLMPNHAHVIISFRNSGQSINTIIGNGKRFIAYDIIKGLKDNEDMETLDYLNQSVSSKDKSKDKQHQVWQPSFDWKHCYDIDMVIQKLDYIHLNPCTKKWYLCLQPADFIHSSARFYATGEEGLVKVTNFSTMSDIDLSS